ncbi:hypothetical protein NKR23_g12510 [Pleurostoma richardsiae]|uniref:Uncharacterized protein n=1 Tax=Pleurostoma richardsiae TaxID=41990 RepID=A0AA38R1H1_9PEZI|nr:hypothetical protein NKR23_g12510 [Pleurostoma richardsiae]
MLGNLEIMIGYRIGPVGIEFRPTLLFTASSSIVRSILHLASKRQWPLEYDFSKPYTRENDDELYMDVSVFIPAALFRNFEEVLSGIRALTTISRKEAVGHEAESKPGDKETDDETESETIDNTEDERESSPEEEFSDGLGVWDE